MKTQNKMLFKDFCEIYDLHGLEIDNHDCISIITKPQRDVLLNRFLPHQGNIESYLTDLFQQYLTDLIN
jgi:hypothetical protein